MDFSASLPLQQRAEVTANSFPLASRLQLAIFRTVAIRRRESEGKLNISWNSYRFSIIA